MQDTNSIVLITLLLTYFIIYYSTLKWTYRSPKDLRGIPNVCETVAVGMRTICGKLILVVIGLRKGKSITRR